MTCTCTASERELQQLGYMLRHARRCFFRSVQGQNLMRLRRIEKLALLVLASYGFCG